MKKMKRSIIASCLKVAFIFAIIGVIISGSYNVIALHKNFFTAEVFEEGVLGGFIFLSYCWINTKKNKIKFFIFMGLLILLISISLTNIDMAKEVFTFNWKQTIKIILYTIEYRKSEEMLKSIIIE